MVVRGDRSLCVAFPLPIGVTLRESREGFSTSFVTFTPHNLIATSENLQWELYFMG